MSDIEELKMLMLDEDFTNIQNLVNEEVNLMDILKVSHKELQHSNFLAWLFNPSETHNLNDYSFKEFIKIYFKENEFQNLGTESGLSVFEFVQMDFNDLEIRREYKNIDLIFLSKKNQLCIVIENKIYSSERKGQLEKYRKIIENEYQDFKHKIFIYLSLKDQTITESEQEYYIQLNYSHIIKLLEQIIYNKRLNIADKTMFVFEQYLQTLKSMLNKNEEIEKIAQQLYRKYKSAFDLVLKYAVSSDGNEIVSYIKQLISEENSIIHFQSNNTYVRFQPKFLYDNIEGLKKKGFLQSSEDLTSNWIFLFEFNIRKDKVNFDFKIGIGDQNIREKVYQLYKSNKSIFTKVDKDLLPKWHQAYQMQILTPKDFQNYDEDENFDLIKKKIKSKFKELIEIELPKILSVIEFEISK